MSNNLIENDRDDSNQSVQEASGLKQEQMNENDRIAKENSIMKTEEGCNCGMKEGCNCGMKNQTSPSFVHGLGRISYVIPNPSIEFEIRQARAAENIGTNVGESAGLHMLLTGDKKDEYRYLARQLCWIFSVRQTEAFVLIPTDPLDYDIFIRVLEYPHRELMKSAYEEPIVDLIIGRKGPISPPGLCGAYALPMVAIDRVQTLRIEDMKEALKKIAEKTHDKKQSAVTQKEYEAIMIMIFERLLDVAESTGAVDEERALTYLASRSFSIYVEAAKQQAYRGSYFENVIPQPVKTRGTHKVVEVVFYFRSDFGLDMFSVEVDVTYEFPYLLSLWKRYYSSSFS